MKQKRIEHHNYDIEAGYKTIKYILDTHNVSNYIVTKQSTPTAINIIIKKTAIHLFPTEHIREIQLIIWENETPNNNRYIKTINITNQTTLKQIEKLLSTLKPTNSTKADSLVFTKRGNRFKFNNSTQLKNLNITTEETNHILQLYNNGYPIEQINEITGLSSITLHKLFQQWKINTTGKRVKIFPDKIKNKAIALYQNGETITAICTHCGISKYHLYKILKTENIQKRQQAKTIPHDTYNKIMMLHNTGKSRYYIQKQTGLNNNLIRKILQISKPLSSQNTEKESQEKTTLKILKSIKELYDKGESITVIGNKIGIETTRINKLLPHNEPPIKDDIKIIRAIKRLYKARRSHTFISNKVGRSKYYVHEIIKKIQKGDL